MRFVEKIIFALILMGLVGTPGFAATDSNLNQAIFTSVTGKVSVKPATSHKTKKARKDLTVFEGDRIITKDKASASLRLFDGSTLDISPNTEFVLSKLQKPSPQDKIIQFKLMVGKLLAEVEKLATSKSSFEIEAGGVVCGVRGTKFSMECDGAPKPQVQLQVFEGTVFTIDGKGNKFSFHPGPPIKFINSLQMDAPKPPNSPANSPLGLKDLNQQFRSNITVNQNKTLNTTQGGTNVTIKPYMGN
jgi:hypothetical protein